jgi:hypothetical protein
MKTSHRSFAAILLVLLALSSAPVLRAQFAVNWFTIDGGGGASAGGGYALHGTLGQPDAAASSGGGYTLQGGFWGGFAAAFESVPSLRIELTGAGVLLAWPNPSTGFQLQESPSLTAPDWTDVIAAPAVVGGEKQVSQSISPGTRFFRLRKP